MARLIAGIGETVLDIVLKDGQPLAAVPGGSVFNSMISLGRTLGRQFPDVELVMESRTGDDAVADLVAGFMRQNHVRTEGMFRGRGQSTVSLAMLDSHNNARYEFFRDPDLPPFPTPETILKRDDIVLFGSTFSVFPETAPQTRAFVRRAREAGAIVYYDINYRRNHPARPAEVEENISMSDIVRGSSEDIEGLYGSDDAARVYAEHIAPLCRNFICTRGSEAAEVFSPGVQERFPTEKVERVVSTIGAGDTFNAGTVYALVRGGYTKERLAALSAQDWACLIPTAMRFSANVCASLYNYVSEEFAGTL